MLEYLQFIIHYKVVIIYIFIEIYYAMNMPLS